MGNNNSFGGKLKKVLASMCSFVVGASGVSQAAGPAVSLPIDHKVDDLDHVRLGIWDGFGWITLGDGITKDMTWLRGKASPSCTINEEYEVNVRFSYSKNLAA